MAIKRRRRGRDKNAHPKLIRGWGQVEGQKTCEKGGGALTRVEGGQGDPPFASDPIDTAGPLLGEGGPQTRSLRVEGSEGGGQGVGCAGKKSENQI